MRVDVDPGAATRAAAHDIRQAFVPHTVDERVEKSERRLSMDDSITVKIRYNSCKGRRGSTGTYRSASVIWGQLVHLTWSHPPGSQHHDPRR